MLHPKGLVAAFVWARRLHRFGFTHWGTVCSSWIWLCRGVSGRSAELPMGWKGVETTDSGNVM
eukprot:4052748-Alexandrium_andersonii.AAC.1